MGKNPQQSAKQSAGVNEPINVWSAQCGECYKWRVIPTLEEYEEIRSKFIEDPFVCSKKPRCSCDQPADIEYNNSRKWVVDKPNLPKTPHGFRRRLVMRKDNSKFDCYYDLLEGKGKTFKSTIEIAKLLDENQEYKKDMSLSDFCFSSPKVMVDTIPTVIDQKAMVRAIPMVIDQPNIPETPPGFRKRMVPRKEGANGKTRVDCYYDIIVKGAIWKTFRSKVEIDRFIDANPEYRMDLSVPDSVPIEQML